MMKIQIGLGVPSIPAVLNTLDWALRAVILVIVSYITT